jgi:hypothetical protein
MSPDRDTIGGLLSEIVEKMYPFPISLEFFSFLVGV